MRPAKPLLPAYPDTSDMGILLSNVADKWLTVRHCRSNIGRADVLDGKDQNLIGVGYFHNSLHIKVPPRKQWQCSGITGLRGSFVKQDIYTFSV